MAFIKLIIMVTIMTTRDPIKNVLKVEYFHINCGGTNNGQIVDAHRDPRDAQEKNEEHNLVARDDIVQRLTLCFFFWSLND